MLPLGGLTPQEGEKTKVSAVKKQAQCCCTGIPTGHKIPAGYQGNILEEVCPLREVGGGWNGFPIFWSLL